MSSWRDVDLLHHGSEKSRSFNGAEPLFVKCFSERVDLDQSGAEWIFRVRGTATNREVILAKSGQQI